MVFKEVTNIQLDKPQAGGFVFREVGNIKLDTPQTQAAPQIAQPIQQNTPKIPVGALPMGLQDIMLQTGEAVEDSTAMNQAMQSIAQQSPEIAGGITGGLAGEKLGRPLGGAGRLAGGIIGGVLGSTSGKEAQQAIGLQAQESTAANLGEATKEEAAARAITSTMGITGKLLAPIVKPITREARAFAESLGLMKPQDGKNIEDLFISSSTFNPQTKDARNIIDAQDNILNERMLTVFEETGGKVDAKRALSLAETATKARQVSDAESAFMVNRDDINRRLQKALSGNLATDKVQQVQANAVRDSFNQYFKGFNSKFDAIKSELTPLRSKIKIPTGDAVARVEAKQQEVINSLGEKEGRQLIDLITNSLRTGVDELGLKKPFTLQDLKNLDNKVKNLIPKFSDSKEVQSQAAGVYAGEIKPILSNLKTEALKNNPNDKELLKALRLEEQFAKLAEAKGALVNSKMGKALGLTEQRQIAKATKPDRVADVIFESPETWEQTKGILQDVNPKLIPLLADNYKAKVVSSVFKEGAPQSTQIANLLSKQGEVIKDIAGERYLTALQDAQMITKALETTKGIAGAKLTLQPEDQIMLNVRRFLVHPLAGRVGLMAGLLSIGKQGIGLGKVTDADILKAMTGKEGEKAINNMTRTFLDNPKAYNNYVQFIREVQKVNDSVEPIDKETFEAQMGAMLSDFLDSPDNK